MSELVDAIDTAARELLGRAMASDKDADGKPTLVTLAERTKAFDSVVEWAKVKNGLAPPKPQASKFELIRSEFNGTGSPEKNKRGGAARKAVKEGAEPGGGLEGGNAGADAASGDGLFAS